MFLLHVDIALFDNEKNIYIDQNNSIFPCYFFLYLFCLFGFFFLANRIIIYIFSKIVESTFYCKNYQFIIIYNNDASLNIYLIIYS